MWRWKWILLAVIVVIPAAVFLISSSLSKTFVASTTLQMKATSVSSSLFSTQLSISTSNTADAARLIETTVVGREAAKNLGENPATGRSLVGQIDTTLDDDATSEFVTITARAAEAQRAADIANAFADAVAITRTEDAVSSIDDTIDTLTAEADRIQKRDPTSRQALADQLSELRALRATQSGTTQVIESAVPPSSPISPKPLRNTALAAVLALLVAAGLVGLLDRLDRRLHEVEELEDVAGAPLLGMIPWLAFPGGPPSPHVHEAFQTLRASLTSFNVDRSLSSVIVASPGHGDGKTTVAVNLAIALAQDGRNVILVDGDLRKPQAAARLGVSWQVGLDAVLVDGRSLDDVLVDVEIEGGRLRVLPTGIGTANPSVLLGSKRMQTLLAEMAEQADTVIIDTPPILAVSDVIPLLDQASGLVLVARWNYTSRDALLRVRQVIETARGSVLGVVATGTRAGGLYGYDNYGYGYGGEFSGPAAGNGAGVGAAGDGIVRRARDRLSR